MQHQIGELVSAVSIRKLLVTTAPLHYAIQLTNLNYEVIIIIPRKYLPEKQKEK